MTKYILHGGNTRDKSPDNDSFHKEMTVGLSGQVNLLVVNFARDDWDEVKTDNLNNVYNSRENIEVVVSEENKFKEQLKEAAVIYLIGGNTFKLMAALSKIEHIEKIFEGKVVAGSSAGAYALCKYFNETDTGEIGEGLGILNFKIVCHFDSSRMKTVEKIDVHKEKLPVFVLPNYKWQVFYK